MKATAIYQQQAAERLNCTEQVNDSSLFTLNSSLSLKRIYRMELRITRAILDFDERHPSYSTALLWAEAIIGAYLVFMYA